MCEYVQTDTNFRILLNKYFRKEFHFLEVCVVCFKTPVWDATVYTIDIHRVYLIYVVEVVKIIDVLSPDFAYKVLKTQLNVAIIELCFCILKFDFIV